MNRFTTHAILAAGLLASASCARAQTATTGFVVEQVKEQLAPLRLDAQPSNTPAVQAYFAHYRLDITNVSHFFGTFESTNYILAAHVFKPAKPVATVIVLHGYYDHAGILRHLITTLIEENYAVAIYDHPGHGLSTGEPASISDFAEYRTVFDDFLTLCTNNLSGPFHLVAHSMGCTIAADYLLTTEKPVLRKIVFIAPLMHSAGWTVSGLSMGVAETVTDDVPRVFRKNSSDKEFLRFMKDDPLQAQRVPLKWANALRGWNERAAKYKAADKPIRIIQGKKDTTVDWKYNIPFLKKKFSNADVTLIPKAGHQLLNETPAIRDAVLKLIGDYLSEPASGQ